MDQCKNCTVRGSLAKCLKTDCSYHELWMVKEIKRVYANEAAIAHALLEAIQGLLDGEGASDFMLSFPIVRRVWEEMEGQKMQGLEECKNCESPEAESNGQ